MRKKQKFEDFSCNSNDSNFSDRMLRSKSRGNNRFTSKSDALNKAIDGRQCDIDDLTDECRSEITDALSDVSDDNSSDPDYDLRVSHKSDPKRKSFSCASIIFVQPTDYEQYEFLDLPLSASDLLLSLQNVWSAVGIYEVLYQFSSVLRLTTFRFENFCAALCMKENTKLLAECHMSLLKCILKEDEQNGIVLTTRDCKDSVSISFYCMDDVTWYENVCMYLESISMNGLNCYRNEHHYYSLTVEQKLFLLQSLIDLFIRTNAAREVLFKENELVHEEHCRSCHKRGNLLCCESCPAMYHLSCIDPPLETIPSGDWYCLACHKQKVVRIEDADCSSMNCQLTFGRKEPLGFDRHGRKYWHLVRRIFVEDDNELLAYYSTEAQLEELLSKFQSEDLEKLLHESFSSSRDGIIGDMKVTESLTNKYKDSRKSCLSHDDEQVNLRRTNQVNVIFDEGPSTKQNETIQNSQSGANNPWSTETVFKLGMECSFRKYSNVYSTEILALSRQQQFEEKERKRHLSYKFSLTPVAEFNWVCGKNVGKFGVNGGHETMLEILRRTVINLQESIPRSFMHANWSLHCSKWLKAISKCTTAREFSLVLMIFEACIRPTVFNNVWHQALGHLTLHRMTAVELEEGKKREKEVRSSLKEELNLNQHDGVKYSLGVHHAIWKQRGEEYRLSGLHSWYWVSPVRASKKRRPNHTPLPRPLNGENLLPNGTSSENADLVNQIFDVERWLNSKTPLSNTTPSTKYLNGLLKKRLQLNEQLEGLITNVQEILAKVDLKGDLPEGQTPAPLSSNDHNVDVQNDNAHDKLKSIESVDNEPIEISKQPEKNTFQSLDSVTKRLESVLQMSSPDLGMTNSLKDLKDLLDAIHSTKLRVSLKKLFPSQRSKNVNGGLPMAHYFEVKKQKRRTDIFVLDKEKLRRLARRSGVMEVPGFNYSSSGSFCPLIAQALSKINPGSSRFVGCPRANFQTSWRFRTRMASNLSYLALQLKVLYACIRWNDMYSSYPSNGILVVDGAEHGTDDVTTYEMLDKRTVTSEFDPVSYRVEYLVRKKVIPKESSQPLPPSNGERTTQRTGLRERRVIEPVISEEFIPEDEMELWQIKYFADVNEKQADEKSLQDKKLLKASSSKPSLVKPSSRPQTPTNPVNRTPSIPTLKTPNHTLTKSKTAQSTPRNPLPNVSTKVSIEDELKRKRMEMRQNRFESAVNSPSSVPSPQTKELPIKVLQTGDGSNNSKSGLCMNELLKHISVIKSPDGKLEVLGLKEGQEAVHLPGGKIKIIVSPTHSSKKSLQTNNQSTARTDPRATKQDASLDEQISDRAVHKKSDEAEEKELIPKEMECQSIQTEVNEHTTKILAGLKDVFQKKIAMSEFNFHHKDCKPPDNVSESLANGASTPTKATQFNNGANSVANLMDSSKFCDRDQGKQMKLQLTPEPSKNTTSPRTKSPPNVSKISCPSGRPTPAKDPPQRPIITVGQFSPANVVPRRMNMFDSPNVDGVADNNSDIDFMESSPSSKNRKRKRDSSEDSHSGSKKIVKTEKSSRSDDSTKDEDAKLHCLCRTPYDNTKFYIGCNNCGGWYHGVCVGLTPEQASLRDKYICELCRQQPSNQLHCLCRTPYDETKFYIGCDECFGWFHGECVGVLATEAQRLESFKCPNCKSRYLKSEEPSMKEEHSFKLLQLLNELKDLPISQAFLDDSIQKNKRGFNFIEEKLLIRSYKTIEEFVEDFEGFFSDLRYYSLKQSVDYKNANRLQSMFLSKLIKLRKRL